MDRTPRWVTWWGYSGTTNRDILATSNRVFFLRQPVKNNRYHVPGIPPLWHWEQLRHCREGPGPQPYRCHPQRRGHRVRWAGSSGRRTGADIKIRGEGSSRGSRSLTERSPPSMRQQFSDPDNDPNSRRKSGYYRFPPSPACNEQLTCATEAMFAEWRKAC